MKIDDVSTIAVDTRWVLPTKTKKIHRAATPMGYTARCTFDYTATVVHRGGQPLLFSVWLDKFHDHPKNPDYSKQLIRFRKLAKNIKKFKKQHKTSDRPEPTSQFPNSFVSFETFLRYIVSETHQDDPHWGSFYRLCAPCDIDYNIITKVETLDQDSDDIFKILKIPKFVGPFPKSNFHSNSVTEEFLKEIFRKLPKELVMRLYSHYEEDFVLFGYGFEEYLGE
jgi:hypothetical protein